MKLLLITACAVCMLTAAAFTEAPVAKNYSAALTPAPNPPAKLSILAPKNNAKVRGACRIYGKAAAGSKVKITITSSYYKTAHDNQERISRGEGPIKRMNRKYMVTADAAGTWTLKNIELWNAGWEETFTIKATDDTNKSVSVIVYDKTHPINID